MIKSFAKQKEAKQVSSNYNSVGDGAIRTKSSAKASRNSYSDAIVYARRFCPCMLQVL
jgi:hypothetical protein